MRTNRILRRASAAFACCLLLFLSFPIGSAQAASPELIEVPWRAYNENG